MSNYDVTVAVKAGDLLSLYTIRWYLTFSHLMTPWLLIMTHMTHHRDQWVTSYKMNTMTSWLRHHFRSLPVWSWPEMIFMGFSERRIFYWLTSHKKFLDVTYRFSKTIAKLLLALKKWTLESELLFVSIYSIENNWVLLRTKAKYKFMFHYRYHIGQGATLPQLTTGIGAQRVSWCWIAFTLWTVFLGLMILYTSFYLRFTQQAADKQI